MYLIIIMYNYNKIVRNIKWEQNLHTDVMFAKMKIISVIETKLINQIKWKFKNFVEIAMQKLYTKKNLNNNYLDLFFYYENRKEKQKKTKQQ